MSLIVALILIQVDPPPVPLPTEPSAPSAWIGIQMADKEKSVAIEAIKAGTPAERCGLAAGDVVIRFNGDDVTTIAQVQAIVKSKKPGEAVSLEIERGGRRHAFRVVLARRPDNPEDAAPPVPGPRAEFETTAAERAVHEARVSELVARLGSDDYDVREAATTSLVKLGPGVVPLLASALKSDDPEVRARAESIATRAPLEAGPAGPALMWRDDWEAALAEAKKAGRGALLYFNDAG